jgi:L-malate glycosyltransferase
LQKALNIFVPHCSGMLTDHLPHGDGLVAHGFIRRLADRGHRLFIAAEQVSLEHALPAAVEVFPLQRRFGAGGLGRLEYMREVRKLYRSLERTVDFDLIHQLNPVYTGISLALWPMNKPLVLGPYVAEWPNDPDAIAGAGPVVRALLRDMKNSLARVQQRGAAAILITTEEARLRVVAPERRSSTHLLPHGVDSDFFSPSPAGGRSPDGSTVILFLANISERKGILEMLNAFDRLGSRFPDARLWIAGGGEHEQSSRAIASRLSCAERIRFLGPQNREQALELFRMADIYCLPSHGEPFGMTVAEAMSCGLPVVVTNSGGVRWIVDAEGGIRVPERAPEELAGALAELIGVPERRKKMGAHNRAKILKQFTWDRVIDHLEEIYSDAMRSHAGAEMTLRPSSVQTPEGAGIYE